MRAFGSKSVHEIASDSAWFLYWTLLGGPVLILVTFILFTVGTESGTALATTLQALAGSGAGEIQEAIKPLYSVLVLASFVLYTLAHFWRVTRRTLPVIEST